MIRESRGLDAQNARCCRRRVRVDRAQWGTLPLGEALLNLRPGKKEKTKNAGLDDGAD